MHYRLDAYPAVAGARPHVVGARQEIQAAAIVRPHRPPYHSNLPRGELMAVPIPNKFLTPSILAAGALLIAAAPPNAVAPDGPALVAVCAPAEDEALSSAPVAETPDAVQQALIDHLSRRFLVAATATERMVGAAYRAASEVGL